MAESLGIDVSSLRGTGTGGSITKADVEAAVAARPAPAAAPARAAPPREVAAAPAPRVSEAPEDTVRAAIRRAIAAAVSRSKREIPHYYLETNIDLTAALGWSERRNAQRPVTERLLPAVLLIKAVAKALRQFPDLNGFWTDGGFRQSVAINVGVAIALRGGGLVVPAIHDADAKSIDELMTALRDLVMRSRAGGLRGSEMTDAGWSRQRSRPTIARRMVTTAGCFSPSSVDFFMPRTRYDRRRDQNRGDSRVEAHRSRG